MRLFRPHRRVYSLSLCLFWAGIKKMVASGNPLHRETSYKMHEFRRFLHPPCSRHPDQYIRFRVPGFCLPGSCFSALPSYTYYNMCFFSLCLCFYSFVLRDMRFHRHRQVYSLSRPPSGVSGYLFSALGASRSEP